MAARRWRCPALELGEASEKLLERRQTEDDRATDLEIVLAELMDHPHLLPGIDGRHGVAGQMRVLVLRRLAVLLDRRADESRLLEFRRRLGELVHHFYGFRLDRLEFGDAVALIMGWIDAGRILPLRRWRQEADGYDNDDAADDRGGGHFHDKSPHVSDE